MRVPYKPLSGSFALTRRTDSPTAAASVRSLENAANSISGLISLQSSTCTLTSIVVARDELIERDARTIM